jgi:hypothetical protein
MTVEEATKESKFKYLNMHIQFNESNERNNKSYYGNSSYYTITIKIFDVLFTRE